MQTRHIFMTLACLALGLPLHGDEPQPKPDPVIDKVVAELNRIAALIKQLDDAKFETRQLATEQLLMIGAPTVEPLKRLVAAQPPLEVAARAEDILRAMKKDKSKADEVRAKLAKPVNLDKGIDPNTPLKDALEFLSDRYDLTMIVNTKAFEAIGVAKAEDQQVQLPKLVGVSMATVLRLMLGQIASKDGAHHATYVVVNDFVEITTTLGVYSADHVTAAERSCLPTVTTDFDRTPLDDALRDVSDRTGTSVVLDGQVGEKGRKAVTARLDAVPVDTAVRLLADMAGLKAVGVDNVLYVTSLDKAKQLQAEQAERAAKRREAEKEAAKQQEKEAKQQQEKEAAPPKK